MTTIEAIEPIVETTSGYDAQASDLIAVSAYDIIDSELSNRAKWDALRRLCHAEDQLMWRNRATEEARVESEAMYRRLFGRPDGTLRIRRFE